VCKLTSQTLSEVLRIVDEAVAVFEKEGPNTSRSSKVMRDILTSVRCYSEIVKEGKKERQKKRT
jgi:hypothetical protein